MVKKRFWKNPYLTILETSVTAVQGAEIQLAETILYAFSGGQESDSGTIGGYVVLKAEMQEQEIVYTLPSEHDLRVGDKVTMQLDWERRYKLMRLHFAAELILELTYRQMAGIQKIGAHIAEDKSRIDFEWTENISSIFPSLQSQAEMLIQANQPIISAFSDESNERRTWTIEGFAQVACGGTHLRTTGEVGKIQLKRKNVGKGKERIEIYLLD